MKATFLLAAGLFFACISCERHDWDETSKLNAPKDEAAKGEHAGAEHAEHGEHAGHSEAGPEKEGH